MSLLLACWVWVAWSAPPTGFEPPPAAQEAARKTATEALGARIEAISATWLGIPYLVDPAGEGVEPDLDPPGRYDAFDCQTFVEEVLSLALATDPVDAGRVRAALRYGDGPMDYAHRRHFMETQWLPGAVRDGWVEDITTTLGPTVPHTRELDAATFARWPERTRFALPDAALPLGTMHLDVLPLAAARQALDRIPHGAILLVVREDRADQPLWVTHLGFVLHRPRPTFRHASHMASSNKVTDHDLRWYLGHLETWTRWPVAGVVVVMPRDQRPGAASATDP